MLELQAWKSLEVVFNLIGCWSLAVPCHSVTPLSTSLLLFADRTDGFVPAVPQKKVSLLPFAA